MQELDELDSQVSQIIKQLELKFGDVVTYKVSATSFLFSMWESHLSLFPGTVPIQLSVSCCMKKQVTEC